MCSDLQPLHEPAIIHVVVKRGMQHQFRSKLSLCALFFEVFGSLFDIAGLNPSH